MNDSPHRNCHILLVDDHADTVRVMQKLLQQRGYVIQTAPTCANAIDRIRQRDFDLVITDISLPDGNGVDLFMKINEYSPTPGMIVSGYGMAQDREESAKAGFYRHFIKPIDFNELCHAIKELCEQAQNLW